MKIAGFSFIRNAVTYDYPIIEAITSILPICDVFYVAVGKSDDGTRELITGLNDPRIQIVDTVWDDSLREGGRVLAEETNKALDAIPADVDWCFYIQGDEVFHEDGLKAVKQAAQDWKNEPKVEGLVLNYRHFFGSYDYIGDSRQWYRYEVRIIRNDKSIRSFRDAQGFQKDGRPLKAKLVNAYMHHYGWVKHPAQQQQKQLNFNKLWHSDDWVDKNVEKVSEFDYGNVDSLKAYDGTHPKVMQSRIDAINWQFAFDPTKRAKMPLRYRLLKWIERKTGWRIGEYRNFRLIR